MVAQVSLTRKYKAARKCISDIFRDIKRHDVEDKAVEINELHPSLKFSHNRDNNRYNNRIAFLDMLICRPESEVTSTWYTKPTDTGLPSIIMH